MATETSQSSSQTSFRSPKLSVLTGPTDVPLWNIPFGDLLHQQAEKQPHQQALVFPESGQRFTYKQIYLRSLEVAKALIASGVKQGDCVGIFAGNCSPYVELIFATAHIGAICVVLNFTYSPDELKAAVKASECRMIFTSTAIGKQSTRPALEMLSQKSMQRDLPELQQTVLFKPDESIGFETYESWVKQGQEISDIDLQRRRECIRGGDVFNLQFTSGTTGSPKAATLTHNNIVNDGRFVGERMRLTPKDILCCPPPLFHCFGLVLGLVAVITSGASIVFPSETFDPARTLDAVMNEGCTALHGVPAMFSAELERLKPGLRLNKLRTGIAAGSPVPRKMMGDLRERLNLLEITNTYGMTETSPASFMSFTDDPLEKRLSTVGKILPHMKAKIINKAGEILPMGSRGELCVAGFALQKSYWKNPAKTAEVMITDAEGTRWMHTGDEAMFDADGYCMITGRIKDIIIRGGENLFPLEIEERLIQHPSVVQASVVGLPDEKYGEIVGAFLEPRRIAARPSLQEVREFVRLTLGWHKAPVHVFWLEEGEEFPKTGSGKIQKHILKDIGARRVKGGKVMSKL